MTNVVPTPRPTIHPDPQHAPEATQIALEVARFLQANGLLALPPAPQAWIALEEAAKMFGYSVSRFYHVYKDLGLVPSRASKRKLRFNRAEIEKVLRDRQRVGSGRRPRQVLRERK